jgi:hypothetical protein
MPQRQPSLGYRVVTLNRYPFRVRPDDSNQQMDGFKHGAVWNGSESRIAMHLVGSVRRRVRVPAARRRHHVRAGGGHLDGKFPQIPPQRRI